MQIQQYLYGVLVYWRGKVEPWIFCGRNEKSIRREAARAEPEREWVSEGMYLENTPSDGRREKKEKKKEDRKKKMSDGRWMEGEAKLFLGQFAFSLS